MNPSNIEQAKRFIPNSYISQGIDARRSFEKRVEILLEKRKLPEDGWNDFSIERLMKDFASMDSNNFPGNVGIGEREGRISSALVAQRHFYLGHGIGRSGDIAEVQPKAAGSSLIAKLTNELLVDVIRMCGVKSVKHCLLLPVATGMALVLVMLSLKAKRPDARYVIWPRIDQKSCFKSILTAGLIPIIIENVLVGDELQTDIAAIQTAIEKYGAADILCIMTTTSCFAPRTPDSLEDVAKIAKENVVPHIVNNAYGVQLSKCMHLIQQAQRVGRLDAFIQSTDKNFMVPVGGAIVAGFDEDLIKNVSQTYPGRASASPIVDVFVTLLSLGSTGYKKLLAERKDNFAYLSSCLKELSARHSERLLHTTHNTISLGITLKFENATQDQSHLSHTEFGSMLFKRFVSGTRVVCGGQTKQIGSYLFKNWGSHSNNYPCSYLTAAASIGLSKSDVDVFIKRLDQVFVRYKKQLLEKQESNLSESLESNCVLSVEQLKLENKNHTDSIDGS